MDVGGHGLDEVHDGGLLAVLSQDDGRPQLALKGFSWINLGKEQSMQSL